MPAAYTHAYIANLVLERIRRGVPEGADSVRVFLPATSAGQASVLVPRGTALALLTHPSSFCFGAASPDFLPDVVSGITTSHQPKNRPAATPGKTETLRSFLDAFARSARLEDPFQLSWLLGWFCHLCADVFGHHWVGVQANGDFLSWLSTDPEVVRRHLGIEMAWGEHIRATGVPEFLPAHVAQEYRMPLPVTPDDAPFPMLFFQRALVLEAMLTEGAPLCERFYDLRGAPAPQDELVQIVHPMIEVRSWKKWHREQMAKVQKAKLLNDSPVGAMLDRPLPRLTPEQLAKTKIPCPLCEAHGTVTSAIERVCPACYGAGMVEDAARGICFACGDARKRREPCAACEGLPDLLRDTCPECHGERQRETLCLYCWGVKETAAAARSLCPHCKGARNIREELDAACPFCMGQKFLEKALGDPAFSTRDLIDVICRRLLHYHQARCERIDRLSNLYLEAGERLALLLLAPKPDLADGKAVFGFYKAFLDEAADFCGASLTLSDLVPELQAYEERVRETLLRILKLPLKALAFVPANLVQVYESLKAEVAGKAVRLVSEKIGSFLTDPEKAELERAALSKYAAPDFPPIADAVTLFLLALENAPPTAAGLSKAFARLGEAANIDARYQPRDTAPYLDPAFPWDDRFRLVGRDRTGEEEKIRLSFAGP